MKENIIKSKSFEFAKSICILVEKLQIRKEFVISKQVLRSGTSIGSNIRESEYAESRNDFIHKLAIALKEANETEYWLDLLFQTDKISKDDYMKLNRQSKELLRLLISIINSMKRKIINEQ